MQLSFCMRFQMLRNESIACGNHTFTGKLAFPILFF